MEINEFTRIAADIEQRESDTEIINRTSAALEAAGTEDLPLLARFLQGNVFPGWDGRKIDIGKSLAYEAIAKTAGTNVTADDVEDDLADIGEIGEVVQQYDFASQQGLAAFGGGDTDSLTLTEVHDEFERLAATEGSGSEDTKVSILHGLFNKGDSEDGKYLTRLVLGEMRIGVGGGTIRDAIAEAFDVSVDEVARAIQVSNDYGDVAVTAAEGGESALQDFQLEVGRPVDAMLAQAGTINDGFEEWDGTVAVDWKFDGARVQAHTDGNGDTRIFSRNLEEVTAALPEVVEYIDDTLDVPAVIDGEVVAVDEDNNPEPFQEILRRFRRKHEVEQMRDEVRVKLVAFDCLHADGEDLLQEPLRERVRHLSDLLPSRTATDNNDSTAAVSAPIIETDADTEAPDLPGAVQNGVAALTITDDPEIASNIETQALESGHEGIMLKDPNSTYSPGKRGKNWLKRKPDVETLDLVVTGAEWGEGRRAKFLGTFMLSVATEDGYETIGKVATGITDDELAMLSDILEPYIEHEDGQEVDITPSVVFEIGYEEIQESPTYESGYALRFPRFISVRDDKTPDDADTLERVERLTENS